MSYFYNKLRHPQGHNSRGNLQIFPALVWNSGGGRSFCDFQALWTFQVLHISIGNVCTVEEWADVIHKLLEIRLAQKRREALMGQQYE